MMKITKNAPGRIFVWKDYCVLPKSIKILEIIEKTVLNAEYYKLFISQVEFNFFSISGILAIERLISTKAGQTV